MADWTFTTASAEARQSWAKKFWIEAKEESYWYGMGDPPRTMILSLRQQSLKESRAIRTSSFRSEISTGPEFSLTIRWRGTRKFPIPMTML